MPMTPAQKEGAARSMGFPSYEAMILFEQQRSRNRAPQTVSGSRGAGMPVNVSQAADQMLAWHPAKIFQKISDVLKGANRSRP